MSFPFEQGMNYSRYIPSELVMAAHELPHLNFKFESVAAIFSIKNDSYLQSLGMCAVQWVFFGLLAMVFISFSGCQKSNYIRIGPPRLLYTTTIMILMGVVAVVALALSVYARFLISDGVDGVQQHWNQSRDDVFDFFQTVSDTSGALTTVQTQLYDTRSEMPASVYNELYDKISTVAVKLEDVLQYSDIVNSSAIPTNLVTYSNIDTIDAAFLGFVGIIMLTIHLVIAARWCCKEKQQKGGACCCYTAAIIVFFLCAIVTGVFYAATVGLGDFCSNATESTTSLMQELDCDDNVVTTAGFYIHCPENGTMIYLTEVDESLGYIEEGIDAIDGMSTPSANVTLLRKDLIHLNSTTERLYDHMMCGEIHSQYVGTLSQVCNNVFFGISATFVALGSLAMVLAISVCLFCSVRRAYKTEELDTGDWEMVQPREYRLTQTLRARRARSVVYEDTPCVDVEPTAPLILPPNQYRMVEEMCGSTNSQHVPWQSITPPTPAQRYHINSNFTQGDEPLVQIGLDGQHNVPPPAYAE